LPVRMKGVRGEGATKWRVVPPDNMKLKVLTQNEVLMDADVDSVTLPGTLGEMTVLPHHAAMLATLKKGKIRYRVKGQLQMGAEIVGGFVEVHKDHVLVLTNLSAESTSQTPEANPSHH